MIPRAFTLSAILAGAVLTVGCASTPGPEPAMLAEVRSRPEPAMITFKGREIGLTPVSLQVGSFSDLLKIGAGLSGGEAVEKRVRFLSTGRAEVTFEFQSGQSSMAKALGLPRILVFDYSNRATFDIDSYELKPELLPLLEDQAEILNTAFAKLDIHVCGHTDSTGADEHNLVLALRRAQEVSDFLAAHGVDRARLKTQGFGRDYPLASNSTPEGRALNRRTEVVLPQ